MGNAFHMGATPLREPQQRLRSHDRLGGKYVLVRRIALGGMGQIWIARNEMTGADVALKVLRADIDKRIQVEQRFRHEARLGAMLSHRNIVRIFDLVEEPDGSLVLVMELLRGETLRRHLKKKGPLHADEAIAIMLPVLSALEHAHEMGVVHRDIKPANIFLAVDPDGHVTPKLLDFGIAKVPQAAGGVQTLDGRVLGTPRYMSPEQIRSETTIDARSDIFSLGAVLVEVLTGHSPFVAETPSASLASVLETLLDPDPRIDPRVWLVLQRALAKRPYERYPDCAELSQALRDAVGVSDQVLITNLRRSKPPPRISATLSISHPDEPVGRPGGEDGGPLRGMVTPANGVRMPSNAGETRHLGDDEDDEDDEDRSNDYAIMAGSQSESVASESISGYRTSNGPPMRAAAPDASERRSWAQHRHVRISRGRIFAFGIVLAVTLSLVFCGGIFFREAHERATSRTEPLATPLPSAASLSTSESTSEPATPASAAEKPAETTPPGAASERPAAEEPAAASAASAGPARRDPAGLSSVRPALPTIRNTRPPPTVGKKKVATTPGF